MSAVLRSIGLAVLVVGAGACLPQASTVTVLPRPLPPLFGASQMKVVKTLQPRSQRFGIAVLNFVDQTGKAADAEVLVASMLAAELKETGRFELADRQQLAEAGAPALAGSAPVQPLMAAYERVAGRVDGILMGYITGMRFDVAPPPPAPAPPPKGAKKDPTPAPPIAALPPDTPTEGELTLELRIVDTLARNNSGPAKIGEIVTATETGKVRFRLDPQSRPPIVLDREDVARVASTIKDRFPVFAERRLAVTEVKGDFITLDVGERDGVRRGLSGYVVEKNDHTGVVRYLAELVVVNVFPGASTAVLLRDASFDPGANVRVGANVVLK